MKTTTPFFPSLRASLAPMGVRTKSIRQSLKRATLLQIEDRLGPALKPEILRKPSKGDHCRQRVFSLTRTFWCWIWQVLQANTSCRHVVRQVQALFALLNDEEFDKRTSAYCQARGKLPRFMLEAALTASASSAQKRARASKALQGRPIKAVDGSGIRLQDTPQNRATYPSSKNQFAKPSFPIMKAVGLICLASGAILAQATGSLLISELRLLMNLAPCLKPKDILLGDRHYGCFVVAAWLQSLEVDLIARLSTRLRHVDFRKAHRSLGSLDGLFIWKKPTRPSPLLTPEQWKALPQQLTVRILRTRLQQRGFRTREVTLITTLLDPQLYRAQEIFESHLKRWRIEMCFDDLKTTLGMEQLSCKSPAMVQKEWLVFLIAHNFIRWVMAEAAQAGAVDLERISFKGTLDAFREWTAGLVQIRGRGKKSKTAALWHMLLITIASDLVPLRPGRQEPRAVKKRSKYPVLNKPRNKYVERWSRNKRRRLAIAKKASC